MSNQDRAAKARDKAFRKAALFLAKEQGYARTLEPSVLEEWLLSTSQRDKDTWTFVWDRALRYADKWWDKQLEEVRGHLEKARGEAVLLSLDLNQAREAGVAQADEVTRLRIENDRLRGQVQNQVTFLRGSRESATRLRKERDELKVAMTEMADKVHSESFDEVLERNGVQARVIEEQRHELEAKERALRLENLRNNNLRRRLDTCEAQLNEARALTTQGTTTVFDENERLMAKVRELEALNESLKVFNDDCMQKRDRQLTILAEEKGLTSTLRAENKHLGDEVRRLTSLLADAEEKLTPAPSRIEYGVPPCNHTWIAEGYTHTCTEPKGHNFTTPGGHRCHCRAR